MDVPQQTWEPLQPLTVFAVKGSNILSLQEVNWYLIFCCFMESLFVYSQVTCLIDVNIKQETQLLSTQATEFISLNGEALTI